jgi:beta-galactosidase/evolved beta-galactosidase subunit alpha
MPALATRETATGIEIRGSDFVIAFDRVHGAMTAWQSRGMPLLKAGPRLNFWRAITDNDRGWTNAKPWRDARLDQLQHRTDACGVILREERVVRVECRVRIAPPVLGSGFMCRYTYTIYGRGDIVLDVQVVPVGPQPETLPRVGLDLELPLELQKVSWFGRGPGETYIDTCQAGRFGLWRAGIEQLHTPYIFPQENGNRSDVRWVSLTEGQGAGLLAVGAPTLNFSVHRLTAMDLENARHTHELKPREDLTLNLDYRQRPLGSASCGPEPWDFQELKPGDFNFSIRLRCFDSNAQPAATLVR